MFAVKTGSGSVGKGSARLGPGELGAVVAGGPEVALGSCPFGEVGRGAGWWFASLAVFVA